MSYPYAPLRKLQDARVVVCSACLLGLECRYDGGDKRDARVARVLEGKEVVPICPEEAAGLGTPRPPADLSGGDGAEVLDERARVVAHDRRDVTAAFRRGAALALEAAQRYGARVAVLKERSPSCGVHRVHVDGRLAKGRGVAAAALERAGVAVLSEEDLPE